MLILEHQIDDFKTERQGVLPPLPMVMRIMPILFYLSILFAIAVSLTAFYKKKVATSELENKEQIVAETEAKIEELKSNQTEFDSRILGLQELEEWIQTTVPVQPLVVTIMNSMDISSTIADMIIARDDKSPALVNLGFHLDADDRQLEKTVDAIRGLDFRETSPQQNMREGIIEYNASLIWVGNAAGEKNEGDVSTSMAPEAEVVP